MSYDVIYQRDGYFFKKIETHLLTNVRQYCEIHQLKGSDVLNFLKKLYPEKVFNGMTKLSPSLIDALDQHFNINK